MQPGARWRSAFVAAAFALHPLHVESVAWVAERKDVLSTLFWVVALWFYTGYARTGARSKYVLALVAFGLGLMSKPMVVTLPCVLLLLDAWPLRRIPVGDGERWLAATARGWLRLLPEKLPFFALAAASAVITVSIGDVRPVDEFSISARLGNALVAYVAYLANMFWPHPLVIFRPHGGEASLLVALGALLVLGAVTAWTLLRARRQPYLPVGWLLYIGTLTPAIGIIQVGIQARADRYTYVPLIGIAIMVAWSVGDWARARAGRRWLVATAAVATTLAMGTLTFFQVRRWQNSITVFAHAVRYEPEAHYSHNNLALAYQEVGDIDRAIVHMREAIRIKPDKLESVSNLGTLYANQGNYAAAIETYERVLEQNPDHVVSNLNMGYAHEAQGDLDAALDYYRSAQVAKPLNADVNNTLGCAYYAKGDYAAAIEAFTTAVTSAPEHADAHSNLARAYGAIQDYQGAIEHFSIVLELAPQDAMTHQMLGVAHELAGEPDRAMELYRGALRLQPNLPEATRRLRGLQTQTGGAAR